MKIQIADCSNSMCRFCALCVTNRFHLLFDIWATGTGCYWCQWKFYRKIISKRFPFSIYFSFIISAFTCMPVYVSVCPCMCMPCDRLKEEKCSARYSSVSICRFVGPPSFNVSSSVTHFVSMILCRSFSTITCFQLWTAGKWVMFC